ncbi:MAG: galactokinase family protein [Verrucomicrobiota bacterium]|nr:galactokinase family protein [Verrucomicrobiota bacterium]
MTPKQPSQEATSARQLAAVLGGEPHWLVRVPGRVDLLGSHTDYNHLPVLACCLAAQSILAEARPTHTREVIAHNLQTIYPTARFKLPHPQPLQPGPAGHWENYLKAGVQGALDQYRLSPSATGWEAVFHSSIPAGAGLSSSSALVIAAAMLTEAVNSLPCDPATLAAYLPSAERFVGTQGGALDHTTILRAQTEHLLHIAFAPPGLQHIPFPAEATLAICHCGQTAEKTGSARSHYNQRVADCNIATLFLRLNLEPDCSPWDLLRDPGKVGDLIQRLHIAPAKAAELARECVPSSLASPEAIAQAIRMPLSATLSAPLLRPNGHPIEFATLHPRDRIVHVLQEAERVHQAAHAFRALDLQRAGSLMTESYQSARTLYDISTPALDQLITAGLQAGALGGRIAGAGFGGCALFLLPTGAFPTWKEAVLANAPNAGPCWEATPGPPAQITPNPTQ